MLMLSKFLAIILFGQSQAHTEICDEIGVRLTVIWHSNRARYEPTVVV